MEGYTLLPFAVKLTDDIFLPYSASSFLVCLRVRLALKDILCWMTFPFAVSLASPARAQQGDQTFV
jgi:hypothetical protein